MSEDGNVNKKWSAALPLLQRSSGLGRISLVGGMLVLTDKELLFRPLAQLGRARRFHLSDIAAVDPYEDKPPRLRITTRDSQRLIVMVFAAEMTPVWSEDASARDEAVQVIGTRLEK